MSEVGNQGYTSSSGRGPAKGRELPGWVYRAMLLMAAVIWGGSFSILKDAFDTMTPAWLIAIRFILSGTVMAIVFNKRLRENLDGSHLLAGGLAGVTGGLGYVVQNLGLADTTASNNAILTATYCVMVPFLAWGLLHRRPKATNVVAAVIALVGIGLISLNGATLTLALRWGDWMTLLGALFFAVQIIVLSQVGRLHDIATMTVVEMFAQGLVSLVVALAIEPAPSAELGTSFVLQMAYLVLLASCATMIFQNVGQKHVPPAQASLLLCLESVFGALFSVLFFGEVLTPQLLGGFCLIFVSVVLSEVSPAELLRMVARRGGGEEA